MREFVAWETHKDASNIFYPDKECLDGKILKNH